MGGVDRAPQPLRDVLERDLKLQQERGTSVTRQEAKVGVENLWGAAASETAGCPVSIDDRLTEEHPWGWIFYFVDQESMGLDARKLKKEYACDGETGVSLPIGTKGLPHVLQWIEDIKRRGI